MICLSLYKQYVNEQELEKAPAFSSSILRVCLLPGIEEDAF